MSMDVTLWCRGPDLHWLPQSFQLCALLHELPRQMWALRDSNPRPSRCKRDALNQLRQVPICAQGET